MFRNDVITSFGWLGDLVLKLFQGTVFNHKFSVFVTLDLG